MADWWPWAECDVCGQLGRKHRMYHQDSVGYSHRECIHKAEAFMLMLGWVVTKPLQTLNLGPGGAAVDFTAHERCTCAVCFGAML